MVPAEFVRRVQFALSWLEEPSCGGRLPASSRAAASLLPLEASEPGGTDDASPAPVPDDEPPLHARTLQTRASPNALPIRRCVPMGLRSRGVMACRFRGRGGGCWGGAPGK